MSYNIIRMFVGRELTMLFCMGKSVSLHPDYESSWELFMIS